MVDITHTPQTLEDWIDFVWLRWDWESMPSASRDSLVTGLSVVEDFQPEDFSQILRYYIGKNAEISKIAKDPAGLVPDIKMVAAWMRRSIDPEAKANDSEPITFRYYPTIENDGRFAEHIRHWTNIVDAATGSLLRWYCNMFCKHHLVPLIRDLLSHFTSEFQSEEFTSNESGQYPALNSEKTIEEMDPANRVVAMLLVHASKPWHLTEYKYWLTWELTETVLSEVRRQIFEGDPRRREDGREDWTERAFFQALQDTTRDLRRPFYADHQLYLTNYAKKTVEAEIERAEISNDSIQKFIEGKIDLDPMKVYMDLGHYALPDDLGPYNEAVGSWSVMRAVKESTPGLYYLLWHLNLLDDESLLSRIDHPADVAAEVMEFLRICRRDPAWRRVLNIEVSELNVLRSYMDISPPVFTQGSRGYKRAFAEIIKLYLEMQKPLPKDATYNVLSQIRGILSGEDHDFAYQRALPIFRSFLNEASLPEDSRRRELNDLMLTADFQMVMDWTRSTFPNPIPANASWGGYVRRSDEWHREQIQKDATRQMESQEKVQAWLRSDSYIPRIKEWASQLPVHEESGYLVIPLINQDQLVAVGDVMRNCVGSSDHYADNCRRGINRIFLIKQMEDDSLSSIVALLQIERRADDSWAVIQNRGMNNAPTSTEIIEVGERVALNYTKAEAENDHQ